MTKAKGSAQSFLALLLSLTMALGNVSFVTAQTGEAASAQYLSTEEGLKFAMQLAKVGYTNDVDTAINVGIGVMSVGFPPAGAALGVAYGLVKALGGGGPDPVQQALNALNERLNQHQKAIVDLQNNLNGFMYEVREKWNIDRIERLRALLNEVKARTDELRLRPTEPSMKRRIVNDALNYAALFLPSHNDGRLPQMWLWSDTLIHKDRGQTNFTPIALPAEFKIFPAFEYYAYALALLLAAVEYESGGNAAYVKKYYGPTLLKHAAFLSVRPNWRRYEDPGQTLPELVKERIYTRFTQSGSTYPTNRVCYLTYAVYDIMQRMFTPDTLQYSVSSNNQMCTFSPALGQWTDVKREDHLERAYGIQDMALLADKLSRLATTGTLKEPEVGQFDFTYYKKNYIYALKSNGELVWYSHLAGVDRNPPKSLKGTIAGATGATSARAGDLAGSLTKQGQASAASSIGAQAGRFGDASGIAGRLGAASKGSAPSSGGSGAGGASTSGAGGALPSSARAQEEAFKPQPTGPRVTHQWDGPKLVATGWQGFRELIPAGLSGIYGLTSDGMLKWYRHDGFLDGTPKWKGPMDVGRGGAVDLRTGWAGPPGLAGAASASRGWNACTKIIAGGDGILYCITSDGTMRWYRHGDVADAAPRPTWYGPLVVGSGWGNFTHVFSTGEGKIYAVKPTGEVLWYWHKGYQMGQNIWEGPKQVNAGWGNFKRVFSPGAGVIYALAADGSVLWYEHEGYRDGKPAWIGPIQIAADWGGFVQVFPRMWGTPIQPR